MIASKPTNPPYLYSFFRKFYSAAVTMQALNSEIQELYDALNALHLPIYTNFSGEALDFVANNLYGIERPYYRKGQYIEGVSSIPDAMTIDDVYAGGFIAGVSPTNELLNDDGFKRLMMWYLYRGDGDVFNINWFKKRIARFIQGDMFAHVNGTPHVSIALPVRKTAPPIGMADYSMFDHFIAGCIIPSDNPVIGSDNVWTVTITPQNQTEQDNALKLKWLIQDGIIELPINNTYRIKIIWL